MTDSSNGLPFSDVGIYVRTSFVFIRTQYEKKKKKELTMVILKLRQLGHIYFSSMKVFKTFNILGSQRPFSSSL